MTTEKNTSHFTVPVINKTVNTLLSQLLSGLMIIVVISPAEHHQALGLGIIDVGKVLKQLLSVGTDSLKD